MFFGVNFPGEKFVNMTGGTMEGLSILPGEYGQAYFGWFRPAGIRYFGQSFVANSNALGTATFKLDVGPAVGEVSFAVRVLDMASGLTLFRSPIQILEPLFEDSPAYGNLDEFQTVSISLDNTHVREGFKYALVVELLPGIGSVETAVNATNPYAQGTLLYGRSLSQLRTAGALDMVLDVSAGIENLPPTAMPDTAEVAENGSVTIEVLLNDTDPDPSDTKRVLSVDEHGLVGGLEVRGDQLVYTTGTGFDSLPEGAAATESFSYTMADSFNATSTARVTVTIHGVNDPLTAIADTAGVVAGTRVSIDVLANDTDPDQGDLGHIKALVLTATKGAASIVDGKVEYSALDVFDYLPAGATTIDELSYEAADGSGAGGNAVLSFTITGVNDPIRTGADAAWMNDGDLPIVVDVLANDTDPDSGDSMHLVALDTGGAKGTAEIVDGRLGYDPGDAFTHLPAGATDVDTIRYTVADDAGLVSKGQLEVLIKGRNDPIVAAYDTLTISESDAPVVIAVLANDVDPDDGDSMTVVALDVTGTHGTASLRDDGSVSFAPGDAFDYLGTNASTTDRFSYTVADIDGLRSSAVVEVTIHGVNDAPIAVADIGEVFENQQLTIDVLANDTDADVGDSKQLVAAGASEHGAVVSIEDGKLVYHADADVFDLLVLGQSVIDMVQYTMIDAAGVASSAYLTVTIRGVADGPSMLGGNGKDVVEGTYLDESLDGQNGNDVVFGMGGADLLFGGNGNDTLDGGAGIDQLSGGTGNDRIDGGNGNDSLTGGNGVDVFVFHAGSGDDTITDFKPQTDRIELGAGLPHTFTQILEHASQHDGSVAISLDSDTSVTLIGVSLVQLIPSAFIYAG